MVQLLPLRVAGCQPLPWAVPPCPRSNTSTEPGCTPLPERDPIAGSLAVPLSATTHWPAALRVGLIGLVEGGPRVRCGGVASAVTVMPTVGVSTLPTTSVARLWMV